MRCGAPRKQSTQQQMGKVAGGTGDSEQKQRTAGGRRTDRIDRESSRGPVGVSVSNKRAANLSVNGYYLSVFIMCRPVRCKVAASR